MGEHNYYVSMQKHDDAVNLSGDKNPIHSIQKYMMGAHLFSLARIHPEIKNQFIQYMRIKFPGSVIMNPAGNTLSCIIKKASETSDFTYTTEIKENGNTVLEGFIKTTSNYRVFNFQAKENLQRRLEKFPENLKLADFDMTEEKIKEYRRILYLGNMSDEEYAKSCNEDTGIIPSYYPIFFTPTEIIKILETCVGNLNNGKRYLYGGSEMEFYTTEVSSKGLQLVGKIPENLGTKSRHHIDTYVLGLEGIVASNRITALAY